MLYFFCENDIRDLYVYRTDAELQEFIDTPVNDITYPPRMNVQSAIARRDESNASSMHPSSLLDFVRQRSYLVKVYDWSQFIKDQQTIEARVSDQTHDQNNGMSIGWRYTEKAIAYMNNMAAQHGATFIVVPIPTANKRLIAILKDIATKQTIPFVDATSLDPSDPSNAALFLPRDGHLSEKGARAMVLLISEHLAKNTSPHSAAAFNVSVRMDGL